jgi:hypothetical protein
MDEYRSSHSVRTVTRSRHTDYAVHWHALERRRSLVHLLGGCGTGGHGEERLGGEVRGSLDET